LAATVSGRPSRQPLILFIALSETEDNLDHGVTTFPLDVLPRWCPLCRNRTIIGHGQRRKQAHDDVHDFIRIRRGRCPPCHKTFTVLPIWSSPGGHYSFLCRQQAAARIEQSDVSWEQSTPNLKDSTRLPDPSTLRRWAGRRLVSLWSWLRSGLWKPMGSRFLSEPTILAWDCPAFCRILRIEGGSP
jgi:hypothetical protein